MGHLNVLLGETWKSTVQRLNAHYKRRHPPQMCGICGRTFDLPSSLSRHMYDHNERCYRCNKCEQSFHFESELATHKVSHRSKSKASFQCMKSKCGKWFMRKWDLTLHLQKHRGKKLECDYKDCTFSTETEKQLKEHYKKVTVTTVLLNANCVVKALNIDLASKDIGIMITRINCKLCKYTSIQALWCH